MVSIRIEIQGRVNNDVDITFRYTMPFANHFKYRHAADDHYHLRYQILSLGGNWLTHFWPCRVFAFFIPITEINAFCAYRFFIWNEDSALTPIEFRR